MNNIGTVSLDEIRKALEDAEVGPWSKVEFFNGTLEVWQGIDNSGIARIIGNNETASANAHLIANAPTWLRSLLEERESHGPEGRNYTNAQVVKLREELEQVKKERDSLPTQWAYDQACKALWKHRDDTETLRSELEQVKKERDDWKYQLEFMSNTAWQDALDSVAVKNEIISLRSELAAKDKELEWYGGGSEDGGEKARSVLSQYAKETES